MKILRGVYEGPASHGVLRIVASLEDVHAVLRAMPGEGYFPALYAERERSGAPAPVTLSPLWKRPQDTNSPGDLAKDVASAARRAPEARAVVVTRSEAALLAGEEPVRINLPPDPSGAGESPKVVLCDWESPAIRETEAAELVLEDLVRAHAIPPEEVVKSEKPSVNLFGPPVFGPGARAEYAEAERMLSLLGVEVNAKVPLGADPEDLARLPRAWANVLLYREIGESATLFLQDEFGMGRVMTPMVGTVGTGAALKAIGRLCKLDNDRVRRVLWGELSQTARLPWYARLAAPEVFEGRRVFIFGDFTYALGLGHTLTREVGLEVPACGTYMRHLSRDFTFHAETFAEEAFVTDDPDEVALRIEKSGAEVVVGTHLEKDVAESLGLSFLPLCPPAGEQPFVERPLLGYAGSSVLADVLEVSLRRVERGSRPARQARPGWTEEALEELSGVPVFLRGRAKKLAEGRAKQTDAKEVTREVFLESRL